MKRLPSVLAIAAASLLFSAGCSTHGVAVEHQASAERPVDRYSTYHLVVIPLDESNETHWMVEHAIHDDLRAKGYVPVHREAADLIVTYDTDVTKGRSDRKSNTAPDGSVTAGPSAEKHITITMTEPGASAPVWRSTATGEVPQSMFKASVKQALADMLVAVPSRHQAAWPSDVAVR